MKKLATKRKRSDDKKDARRPGRRPAGAAVMQPQVTAAIEEALLEEWARTGYAALSVEAVAKRAGVGKAAVYRRWSSKLELAIAVLSRLGLEVTPIPDTGSLERDVLHTLRAMLQLLQHRLVRRILPDLHAEMSRNSKLARALRSGLQAQRRERGAEMLKRAVERGELSESLDLDLALDMLGSMVYWRTIVTQQEADHDYLRRLARFVTASLEAQ